MWTTFVPCGQRIQFFVRCVKFVGAEKDTKRQGDGSLLNGCLQMRNGSDTILNRDPSIFAYRNRVRLVPAARRRNFQALLYGSVLVEVNARHQLINAICYITCTSIFFALLWIHHRRLEAKEKREWQRKRYPSWLS